MENREFEQMMSAATGISQMFPEGVVYIGGIAVYMHLTNIGAGAYAEFTHDGDFYISIADMADLRDIEEVTANRRQTKHQLIKSGFEFDIYTETHSKLIVPYDAVMSRAVSFDEMRVAGLEHLLALKLEAYSDRRQSVKGEKDSKDILRIATALQAREVSGTPFDPEQVVPYLRDSHMALLREIEKSTSALSICKGNAHQAKSLRLALRTLIDAIDQSVNKQISDPSPM